MTFKDTLNWISDKSTATDFTREPFLSLSAFSVDGQLTVRSSCELKSLTNVSTLFDTAFYLGGQPIPHLMVQVIYDELEAFPLGLPPSYEVKISQLS